MEALRKEVGKAVLKAAITKVIKEEGTNKADTNRGTLNSNSLDLAVSEVEVAAAAPVVA